MSFYPIKEIPEENMNLLTRFRFLLSVVIGFFLLPFFQMAVFAQDYSPHLVVNTGFLNIRNGPGANHDIMANVPGGTKLPVLAMASDRLWYQVESAAGVGWVNSYYTVGRGNFADIPVTDNAAEAPAIAPARVIVNTAYLNIRTGPSASNDIVTTLSGGVELTVLGVAKDGVWYLVEGDFGQGWLNNSYVIFRGDYSSVLVIE